MGDPTRPDQATDRAMPFRGHRRWPPRRPRGVAHKDGLLHKAERARRSRVGLRTVLVTGISHRSRHPSRRTRAGPARRVGVQVQSVAHLPRKALRSATTMT